MPLSVMVTTFTGAVEARCTHPAIGALCVRAARLGLPMLGGVDPYDDTVFNRAQLRPVLAELRHLAADAPPDEAQAASEIVRVAERVETAPHRYLLFNGD